MTTPETPDPAPTPDSNIGALSPDGMWRWDGTTWQPTGAPLTGKAARAQARAAKAARKAQRPWVLRHKILTGIGAVVIIVIVASIAASSGGSKSPSSAANTPPVAVTPAAASTQPSSPSPSASPSILHSEDVKITGCANSPDTNDPAATVVVTNHSSKASNYIITISFTTADGKTQLGTGDVAVNNLLPGQSSAPQTADSLASTPGPAGFTCQLAQLDRYAS